MVYGKLFKRLEKRLFVAAIDWEQVSRDLDAQGSAMIEHLLSPEECETGVHTSID